jgi:hypothetical protein
MGFGLHAYSLTVVGVLVIGAGLVYALFRGVRGFLSRMRVENSNPDSR